eukprot:scaffold201135_cov24-Tisochrysis_lutea.AAC.1
MYKPYSPCRCVLTMRRSCVRGGLSRCAAICCCCCRASASGNSGKLHRGRGGGKLGGRAGGAASETAGMRLGGV